MKPENHQENEDIMNSFNMSSGIAVWGQLDSIMDGTFNYLNKTNVSESWPFFFKIKKGRWIRTVNEYEFGTAITYHHEDNPVADVNHVISSCFSYNPNAKETDLIQHVSRYDWGFNYYGLHRDLRDDDTSFYLIDLDYMLSVYNSKSRYDDDDEEEDEDDEYDEDDEASRFTCDELKQLFQIDNEDNDDKYTIFGSNTACYDRTFVGNDWLNGRMIFNDEQILEAFIISDYDYIPDYIIDAIF